MDAEKMTITLDTEDMRTVLASVGFVVCDWKEKARHPVKGGRITAPPGQIKIKRRLRT